MNFARESRIAINEKTEYATVDDFRKLFTAEMESLYLLALLLTADDRKAEATFVAGIEDAANSSKVFREWAHSWAKRVIIRNAIAAIRPVASKAGSVSEMSFFSKRLAGAHARLANVLALEDFERVVFVLSVLEQYSFKECSLLLDCSLADVHRAQTAALTHLAAKNSGAMGSVQPPNERSEYAIH